MKQHCYMAAIYGSWVLYVGTLMALARGGQWILGLICLVGVPLLEWWYIRRFPRLSAGLGYGRIIDEPATVEAAGPAAVTLYTALGCPFCPLMEHRLEELRQRLGFRLQKIDVTLRPDVLARKGIRSVPAVEIGDRFFTGLATSKELADAIAHSAVAK